MVVPGRSVVPWEQKLTSSATSKMRSLEHPMQSVDRNYPLPSPSRLLHQVTGQRGIYSLQPTLLHHLSVQQPPQLQLRWVLDHPCRHQRGPKRAGTVVSLGVAPLALVQLAHPARDVVVGRIPQHVAEGLLLADVLAGLADDHGELALEVGRVVLQRVLRDDRGCRPGVRQGGGRLAETFLLEGAGDGRWFITPNWDSCHVQEDNGDLRDLHADFVGVSCILYGVSLLVTPYTVATG